MNILRLYIVVFLCFLPQQVFGKPDTLADVWQQNILQVKVKKRPIRSFSLWSLAEKMRFPLTADLPYVDETGVGFLWAGQMYTSYHLIAGAEFLGASRQGKLVKLELVYANPSLDVAVFRPLSAIDTHNVTRKMEKTAQGDKLRFITLSKQGNIEIVVGMVLHPEKTVNIGYRQSVPLIEVAASLEKGASGSPVIDQAGNIVGMIVAAEIGTTGYILPLQTIVEAQQVPPLPEAKSQLWLARDGVTVQRVTGGCKEMGLQQGDILHLPSDATQIRGVFEMIRSENRFFVALPSTEVHWE